MNDLNELLQEAKDAVGPGWWPIIDKYLPSMVELASEGDFDFKEKYGTLRLRAYGPCIDREKFIQLELAAEDESATVCEQCGAPGKLRNDLSWIETLCDLCYQEVLQRKTEAEE